MGGIRPLLSCLLWMIHCPEMGSVPDLMAEFELERACNVEMRFERSTVVLSLMETMLSVEILVVYSTPNQTRIGFQKTNFFFFPE